MRRDEALLLDHTLETIEKSWQDSLLRSWNKGGCVRSYTPDAPLLTATFGLLYYISQVPLSTPSI